MKVDYKDVKTELNNIKNKIEDLLVSHGGMSNGYLTYAEGSVEKNCHGFLKICIPSKDITIRKIDEKSSDVEDSLKKEYKDILESGICIIIKKRHLEHGCYDHIVSLQ